MSTLTTHVLVVLGAGGIGLAAARRLGSGRTIVLADFSEKVLNSATESLRNDGHIVVPSQLDVTDYAAVEKLAQKAAEIGHLDVIVQTAGVSPTMATVSRVYKTNLLGTVHVIDAFYPVVSQGTVLVCTASAAGHSAIGTSLSPALEAHLASAPRDKVLTHPELNLESNGETAYSVSKRANIIRCEAACLAYGAKGARINSVSPGVIVTPLVQFELTDGRADVIAGLVSMTPLQRKGASDEVATAIAFLASTGASFINGADLRIDGGIVPFARHAATLAGAAAVATAEATAGPAAEAAEEAAAGATTGAAVGPEAVAPAGA